MADIAGQMAIHIARRSIEQYSKTTEGDFSAMSPDAKAGLSSFAVFLLIAIGALTFLIIASADYTLGSVVATLAMVESPPSTATVKPVLSAYSDEPDAPLEEKAVLREADMIATGNKLITARIATTIEHLNAVGGFFARWRGILRYILYALTTNSVAYGISNIFGIIFGPVVGQIFGYSFAVICTWRLHMLWTHAIIATPSGASWNKQLISLKQCRGASAPVLQYAIGTTSIIAIPAFVAWITGVVATPEGLVSRQTPDSPTVCMLRILAVAASYVFTALFIYVPAKATLVIVEACLLPEDQQTIVRFDREGIMGDIDTTTEPHNSQKLFAAVWQSFDRAARIRVAKVYLKLFAFQFATALVGACSCLGVLYLTDHDSMDLNLEHVTSQIAQMARID